MNITSESFMNNKDRLLGSTFLEKAITLHDALTEREQKAWAKKVDRSEKIHFEDKITPDDIETDVEEIPDRYLKPLLHQAREFSYLSLRGFIGVQDLLKGTMRAHASLNERQGICDDDLKFLLMIKPYLLNPFSPYEGKIAKYASQGLSYRSICKKIGKSKTYANQVRSVVGKARIRGIIPLEKKTEHFIRAEREGFYGA